MGRLQNVKMSICPTMIYKFSSIPHKNSRRLYLFLIDVLILKFIRTYKALRVAKRTLKNKSQIGGLTTNCKTKYKVIEFLA